MLPIADPKEPEDDDSSLGLLLDLMDEGTLPDLPTSKVPEEPTTVDTESALASVVDSKPELVVADLLANDKESEDLLCELIVVGTGSVLRVVDGI